MRVIDRDISRAFANAYRNPRLAVLEGFHPACHAVRFGAELDLAVTYNREKLLRIAERLAPDSVEPIERNLHVVERAFFDRLTRRSLSSPLLSFAVRPAADAGAVLGTRGSPAVFLERPRNPGNVGAVIRVAAAAGVAGVLVSGTVDPWSTVVLRSAAGLQFALPVAAGELPEDLDRPIVALDADGEPLRPVDLDPASVLVVGGERYGLSGALRARAERVVAVPMAPGVSSLNLSNALAAVLFSWRTAAFERSGAAPW